MGIKKLFHELKTKVSASRLFKALITDSHNVLPKCSAQIKGIEFVEGSAVSAGCVMKSTFPDGAKYVKYRIDSVDQDNYVCKYTLFEGEALGDKLDKVCYELKLEATDDGGCVIKVDSEYHTKGDAELNEDEIEAGKQQAFELYKACEKYLIDNPSVCA